MQDEHFDLFEQENEVELITENVSDDSIASEKEQLTQENAFSEAEDTDIGSWQNHEEDISPLGDPPLKTEQKELNTRTDEEELQTLENYHQNETFQEESPEEGYTTQNQPTRSFKIKQKEPDNRTDEEEQIIEKELQTLEEYHQDETSHEELPEEDHTKLNP
jgi:hypothetical protein